jgi:hypothetical protein
VSWQPTGQQPTGWQPEGWQPEGEAGPSAPVLVQSIPGFSETFDTGTHEYDLSAYFTGADTYAIAPAVETGWAFDTNTGVLTIDTDALGNFGTYVVTATNATGDTASNAFGVAVVAVASTTSVSGGWLFFNEYEQELRRRQKRKKEQEELEEATEQIEDTTDRQIAQLLREQEAKDEKRKELQRLAEIVRQNADIEAARQYGAKVAKAYERALTQGNFSALQALDRELKKARDEEEALLLQAFMLE